MPYLRTSTNIKNLVFSKQHLTSMCSMKSSVVNGVELTTVIVCWTAGECFVSRCAALQDQKTLWLHALLIPFDTVTVITEPRWMHGGTFCIHTPISHTSWKMYLTLVHITQQLNWLKLIMGMQRSGLVFREFQVWLWPLSLILKAQLID